MEKMKKMKKKLFIGGAYLVVALLLLIYVSYSAYKISFDARVLMPEALAQHATLNLSYNQEIGKASDSNVTSGVFTLEGIKPGQDITTAAGRTAAETDKRKTSFTISNEDIVATDSQTGEPIKAVSKLKMVYRIYLEETGVVPLDVIIVDKRAGHEGQMYRALTDDIYQKRSVAFRPYTEGQEFLEDADPAEFTLGNNTLEKHNFDVYVGWNNRKGSYPGEERKEIATVELKTVITECRPIIDNVSSYDDPTQYQNIKTYIATSSQATPGNATPGNATPGQRN